jgi:ABC-2 family transporter protein
MLTAGHCAATAIEILGIFALFDRFGPVGGWSFSEAALFYALVNIMFSIADLFTRGFEVFGTDFVRTGAFDRVLLRPRAAALQLAGHEVRLSRLGRLLQGFAVLILASSLVPIDWDAAAVAIAVWAVAGGVALFTGILVLQATLAFWTVESLEILNVRRRRPGSPISAQHLRGMVSASAHLRRAARLRGLLPDPRHFEATGPARRAGLDPATRADRRLYVPWAIVPCLARRDGALRVHG